MKIPKPILERRRSVRVEETLPFRIGHCDYEIRAETINVGAHGAMCLVEKDIPVMTQLSVALSLPRGKSLHVRGVVVRKEKSSDGKFYVAVFFNEMKPQDQKALSRFIESSLKKTHGS